MIHNRHHRFGISGPFVDILNLHHLEREEEEEGESPGSVLSTQHRHNVRVDAYWRYLLFAHASDRYILDNPNYFTHSYLQVSGVCDDGDALQALGVAAA